METVRGTAGSSQQELTILAAMMLGMLRTPEQVRRALKTEGATAEEAARIVEDLRHSAKVRQAIASVYRRRINVSVFLAVGGVGLAIRALNVRAPDLNITAALGLVVILLFICCLFMAAVYSFRFRQFMSKDGNFGEPLIDTDDNAYEDNPEYVSRYCMQCVHYSLPYTECTVLKFEVHQAKLFQEKCGGNSFKPFNAPESEPEDKPVSGKENNPHHW